ncbi:MAG: tartrate dehydrogenase [Candidatus Solibacter usitatus]|nr:tartrate dehydrogenase [Candidatus Solibacter usitatus]
MTAYNIHVIAGDGIGTEVTACGMKILEAAARQHGFDVHFTEHDWGSDYFFRQGRMMPVNGLDTLRAADAIALGAVGHPDIPDHITLHGLLLPIRRGFDQYVNVRPAVLFTGVESPLAGFPPRSIDMVVIRENTEGEYAPVGGFVHHHHAGEVAVQSAVFTRAGCERVIRFAFELAMKRRRRVTSVTKSNAQAYGMVLWDRVFQMTARDFPDVETESLLVDAAAMNFIRRPDSFDVVVASNLFGDILSDVSAIAAGSIGLAASANIDPTRQYPSLFEPVHGSAPDIVGRGIANPLASILSVSMMLEHLGQHEAGRNVEAAVRAVLSEGSVRTPDLGGTSSTSEVRDAVLAKL